MRTLLLVVLGALGLGACASQQMKFETIDHRDKLRFAACRRDVARAMCPDDPDCAAKAAEVYAAESHDSRRRWLIDYHCPPEVIDSVDKKVKEEERGQEGMR